MKAISPYGGEGERVNCVHCQPSKNQYNYYKNLQVKDLLRHGPVGATRETTLVKQTSPRREKGCSCVRACVRACVRVCVCACMFPEDLKNNSALINICIFSLSMLLRIRGSFAPNKKRID